MKIKYTLWLLFLLTCSCTTPQVITKISPEAPEGYFANGREYIPLENDQIAVELGYDGLMGHHLVFDFVVHNGSGDTLHIRPSDFFYVVLDSADAESDLDQSWFSVHPDTVLRHYDKSLKDREEAKEKNTFLGILHASVDLLYHTSGFIATEDPGFIVDGVFSTAGTADHYISRGKILTEEMDMIGEEKELVSREIFRLCKLAPGQLSSGYVYFPLHEQCAYYMFCFPVGQQLFQFVYRQQKELVYY
jgi:hypothetical protein